MNRNIIEEAQRLGLIKPNTMELIENRQCPLCETKIDINEFTDELSLKEFTVSGMCQKCQDRIFVEPKE